MRPEEFGLGRGRNCRLGQSVREGGGAKRGGRFGPAPRLTAWAPLLSSAATPGFWAVLQENGPEFDVLPEFCAVFPALRRGPRYQ